MITFESFPSLASKLNFTLPRAGICSTKKKKMFGGSTVKSLLHNFQDQSSNPRTHVTSPTWSHVPITPPLNKQREEDHWSLLVVSLPENHKLQVQEENQRDKAENDREDFQSPHLASMHLEHICTHIHSAHMHMYK